MLQLRRSIAKQKQAVLLETPDTGTVDTSSIPISIYAFNPVATLKFQQGVCITEGFDLPNNLIKSPFKAIKYLIGIYAQKDSGQYPFEGGLMGYFGYQFGNQLEAINTHYNDHLSLPDLWLGYFPVAIIIDQYQTTISIVGLPEQQSHADELLKWIEQIHETTFEPFKLVSDWQSNMTYEDYFKKFSDVQDYLFAGDCYQVNLAQRWHAQFRGSNWSSYEKLFQQNSAPFSAFINLDENLSIMSLSPERFISSTNKDGTYHCETRPIKGTRKRSENLTEDLNLIDELASSTKDKAENVMIVDLMRNDFSKVCESNSVKVTELFKIETFPAVHHLVSTITGTLAKSFDSVDLLQACFPGGSITGAPKKRAMEIIAELEPDERSVYCGSIGYISNTGNMDTNIAIRTLVCQENTIYCWAGGGLVADSDVELEYQETHHKVSTILPLL